MSADEQTVTLSQRQWSAIAHLLGCTTADEFSFPAGEWDSVVVPAIEAIEAAAEAEEAPRP